MVSDKIRPAEQNIFIWNKTPGKNVFSSDFKRTVGEDLVPVCVLDLKILVTFYFLASSSYSLHLIKLKLDI